MTRKKINLHWWESNFPCYQACPVHTEAGRYVSLIAQGRYAEAYRVARRTNPLASICGRICAAPCEDVCTRGSIDTPISIRALKRFVCERYGVESMLDLSAVQALLRKRLRSTGKWVAVVGGGPAGLAAAHDLALLGHQVSLFEAQDVLGGMLTLGIPEYRLPRELIRLEINAILNLGIDVHLGKKLGRDFSLADLQENGYGAVFLALGAHQSRELKLEGIHADGVIQALDFLLNVNRGYRVQTGERVLVIGGGSVAFDVARTAARQPGDEEPQVSDMVSALDVARSAIRFGAKDVEIICLESASEMPAAPEEIEDAREEGIHIHHSRGPKRILTRDGKVTGLEVLSVASVFDDQGRFNPKMIPGSEQILETDSIIIAIGQEPDFSFLSPADGLEIQANRTIRVNPNTLASSLSGVWAGGDVAFGPRNVIHAVADGKRAALSIHRFLMKLPENPENRNDFIYVPDVFAYQPVKDFDSFPAQKPPKLALDRRTGIAQVELGFSEEPAMKEGSRCLHCWFNTIFDGREEEANECVLCGACADICPEWCIDILPRRVFSGELSLMNESRGPDQANGLSGPSLMDSQALIIKDESRCIRCGLCAKRCPVNCISMQGIFFGEAR